jgi:hypothetical protein
MTPPPSVTEHTDGVGGAPYHTIPYLHTAERSLIEALSFPMELAWSRLVRPRAVCIGARAVCLPKELVGRSVLEKKPVRCGTIACTQQLFWGLKTHANRPEHTDWSLDRRPRPRPRPPTPRRSRQQQRRAADPSAIARCWLCPLRPCRRPTAAQHEHATALCQPLPVAVPGRRPGDGPGAAIRRSRQ